jgi:preprotein translocase subunit YajC
MVEIFLEAPLELRILIGATLICGAWFMYSQYRAEQKRKQRHQKDLNESFKKAKLTLVKK